MFEIVRVSYLLANRCFVVSERGSDPEGERPYAGSVAAADEEMRRLAARVVDRSSNIASSMTNPWLLDGGEPWRSTPSAQAA